MTVSASSMPAFGASVVIVTVSGSGAARPLIVVAVPSLYAWAPLMPLMPPP